VGEEGGGEGGGGGGGGEGGGGGGRGAQEVDHNPQPGHDDLAQPGLDVTPGGFPSPGLSLPSQTNPRIF